MKLTYLKDNISYFAKVSKSGGISYSIGEGRYTYWHYKDGLLTEKYVVPNLEERSLFQENGDFYTTITNDSTGYEIYQLGAASLMAYQEIVAGLEGIELRNVFSYHNEIYVYGFTYTYGWQVWKMGAAKSFITHTEPTEEVSATHLSVFPNPTQDWLHIKSEKTLPYRLINTRGQILMQGNIFPQQGINLQQLPQGIYLLQLSDGGRVFVKKVVKE